MSAKKPRLIDLESTEGIAEFQRMARKQHARRAGKGLGSLDNKQLLKSLAAQLEAPTPDPEHEGDYVRYTDDLADARVLREYMRARYEQCAWKASAEVLRILERLKDHDVARELLDRAEGARGRYDPKYAATYWGMVADEHASAGNQEAAKLSRAIAAKRDGGHDMFTDHVGEPRSKVQGLQHWLNAYVDFMEANRSSYDTTRDAQDAFLGDSTRKARGEFTRRLLKATNQWAENHEQEAPHDELLAWVADWRWPQHLPRPA